ncbi:DNA cytosine methyltransferase, partial [Dysosmobacter sp.]
MKQNAVIPMERRVRGNSHARCGVGENPEIASKDYLSLFPGAFSSNSGEDFKAVLEAVIGVARPGTEVPMPERARWPYADCYMGDGWSVAYRVLDAQFWGVPQRRKRIYLVADFAGGSAFDIR